MAEATAPDDLDIDDIDQYSEAEIEAYNEQRKQEILDDYAALNEAQQEAVDALRADAQESLDTATVTLSSGVELDVRTRMPPRIERLQEKLQRIQDGEDVTVPYEVIHSFNDLAVDEFVGMGEAEMARHVNAYMLAEMTVAPEGYTEPDVWAVASNDGAAGIQWLLEATDTVIAPAVEHASQHAAGNGRGSNGTANQTRGRQSGQWQKR